MPVKIYHNPRCSKSRQTLEIIKETGLEPEIVEYLKTPPDSKDIEDILNRLENEPRAVMRKNEPLYRELGLDDPAKSREDLIAAMTSHPILIERPIVITEKGACIARPPERVRDIL